jgi:hypothetical protein
MYQIEQHLNTLQIGSRSLTHMHTKTSSKSSLGIKQTKTKLQVFVKSQEAKEKNLLINLGRYSLKLVLKQLLVLGMHL